MKFNFKIPGGPVRGKYDWKNLSFSPMYLPALYQGLLNRDSDRNDAEASFTPSYLC